MGTWLRRDWQRAHRLAWVNVINVSTVMSVSSNGGWWVWGEVAMVMYNF